MTLFGIPYAELAPVIILFVLIYAFRDRILRALGSWYHEYKEQQKRNALYDRLDRNAAGKFSKKDYLKSLNQQKKAGLKKNREQADEKRQVQGK